VAIGPQLGVGDQSTGIMLQGVAPESRLGPIDPDRRGSACHERDDLGCEPLQALDALRDGLAAAIENQLVHADRRESSNVAGDVFRFTGEGPAGPIRRWNADVIERRFIGDRQRREVAFNSVNSTRSSCARLPPMRSSSPAIGSSASIAAETSRRSKAEGARHRRDEGA
jgi:hypothetical protein